MQAVSSGIKIVDDENPHLRVPGKMVFSGSGQFAAYFQDPPFSTHFGTAPWKHWNVGIIQKDQMVSAEKIDQMFKEGRLIFLSHEGNEINATISTIYAERIQELQSLDCACTYYTEDPPKAYFYQFSIKNLALIPPEEYALELRQVQAALKTSFMLPSIHVHDSSEISRAYFSLCRQFRPGDVVSFDFERDTLGRVKYYLAKEIDIKLVAQFATPNCAYAARTDLYSGSPLFSKDKIPKSFVNLVCDLDNMDNKLRLAALYAAVHSLKIRGAFNTGPEEFHKGNLDFQEDLIASIKKSTTSSASFKWKKDLHKSIPENKKDWKEVEGVIIKLGNLEKMIQTPLWTCKFLEEIFRLRFALSVSPADRENVPQAFKDLILGFELDEEIYKAHKAGQKNLQEFYKEFCVRKGVKDQKDFNTLYRYYHCDKSIQELKDKMQETQSYFASTISIEAFFQTYNIVITRETLSEIRGKTSLWNDMKNIHSTKPNLLSIIIDLYLGDSKFKPAYKRILESYRLLHTYLIELRDAFEISLICMEAADGPTKITKTYLSSCNEALEAIAFHFNRLDKK